MQQGKSGRPAPKYRCGVAEATPGLEKRLSGVEGLGKSWRSDIEYPEALRGEQKPMRLARHQTYSHLPC